jgi:hypothetical protein
VGTNQSGIEHQILVVGIACEIFKNPLPHAAFRPPREPFVDALPVAIPLRQIAPASAGAQHPQNTVDEQTIVAAGASRITRLARKQGGDPPPLDIGQFVPLHHSSRFESIDPKRNESALHNAGNLEGSVRS